jgi:uncharacterized membrane protein YvbJ
VKRLFVCEKCGNAVRRNATVCDFCGQVFSGIKCPRCGFSGDADLFSDGCPVCGFTGSFGAEKADKNREPKKTKLSYVTPKKEKKMLPLFIYRILGIIAFILIVILVIFIIIHYS